MSKSKKKGKNNNDQKRSNKFNASKLRTNQSRSAFRAQNALEAQEVAEEKKEDAVTPVEDVAAAPAPEVVNTENNVEAKEVETTAEVVENKEVAPTESPKAESKKEKNNAKDDSKVQKDKDKKDKQKKKAKKDKPKFGQRTKETFGELKRVTWPTFKETMKKTGLVIAVVLFFGVALFAIERLLSWLYTLLTSGIID